MTEKKEVEFESHFDKNGAVSNSNENSATTSFEKAGKGGGGKKFDKKNKKFKK